VAALSGIVLVGTQAYGGHGGSYDDASLDGGPDVSISDGAALDSSGSDAPSDVGSNDGPSGEAGGGDASQESGADAVGTDGKADAPGIFLPGTQPHELTVQLRPAGICADCHGQYADYEADSTWRGTMMANAARDPLFHAALTVAKQDVPESGDFCIRCHSPRGWLFGRSEPALISNLEPADLESVQCDFCHRLNTGPTGTPYIGNGQYFVANDFTRRGPIRDAKAPHDFEYSAYHEESRLCGICHDVSNPVRNGFAIERTFTEWSTSAFAAEGQSCQSCHMPSQRGFACGAPDMPEREVHSHEFAGGNYWMPRVLSKENPDLGYADSYEKTAKSAEAKLRTASELTLQAPSRAAAGEKISFRVRVENKTGHKLPTGYPEGRRMWLEVEVDDETGVPIFHSGAYDRATATRASDPQLRTYEVRLASQGVEGFHFMLQDEVLQDNRIPPRGFVPRPDTKPVGRDYPTVSSTDGSPNSLANWDDAPYELTLPASPTSDVDAGRGDGGDGMVVIRATLWYQTTSREYVESLRSANGTDDYGQKMLEIWERNDRAPPFSMATAMGSITIERPVAEPAPEPLPEAGTGREGGAGEPSTEGGRLPEADSGGASKDAALDAPTDDGAGDGDSGCSCSLAVPQGASYQASFGFLFGLIGLLGHSRARPRRRRFK